MRYKAKKYKQIFSMPLFIFVESVLFIKED